MRNTAITFLVIFNFALGIYAGVFFNTFYKDEFQLKEEVPQENRQELAQITAPYDRINENNIEVYKDKIIINLQDLKGRDISWATYADTKSMVPTIGKGCNGLEFVPSSPNEVHKGDLVAFQKGDSLIIHRVISTGVDEFGWFAVTKGDNNQYTDGKVSFDDIKFITFGIIC